MDADAPFHNRHFISGRYFQEEALRANTGPNSESGTAAEGNLIRSAWHCARQDRAGAQRP
jgi:hypothetical protein